MKEKTKRKKEKPSYSLLSNVVYLFGLQWQHSKMFFLFLVALIPLSLGISFCNIYLPKLVVSEVTRGETTNHMVMAVASFGLIITVLNSINKIIGTYMYAATSKFNHKMALLAEKRLYLWIMKISNLQNSD